VEQIEDRLAAIVRQFADKRIYLCQLEVGTVADGRITLNGSVLDEETLTAVTSQLLTHFPDEVVDVTAVTILRQPQPQLLAVHTTITGLHNSPNFLAEPGSQLLNGMVVELLQTEGRWAFVRQLDGYLGWLYRPYLGDMPATEATHLVCEPVALLRAEAKDDAPVVNRVLAGTAVTVRKAQANWQQIELVGGVTGWRPADNLRPLTALPQTEAAQRTQLVADAHRFIGVPYLWAGASAYGLDCSGYVQLLYRLSGLTLPRDADMQYTAGRPINPPYQPGDLFFFGSEGDHRRISHVGMSLGGWQMIHASRGRNGVFIDNMQEVAHLKDSFVGAVAVIE
jgi:cell wall-associated NlpC family hydrolase